MANRSVTAFTPCRAATSSISNKSRALPVCLPETTFVPPLTAIASHRKPRQRCTPEIPTPAKPHPAPPRLRLHPRVPRRAVHRNPAAHQRSYILALQHLRHRYRKLRIHPDLLSKPTIPSHTSRLR